MLSAGCPGIDDPNQEQEDLVEGPGVPHVLFSGTPLVIAPPVTPRPDPSMEFITYILNKAGALPRDHWDRKFLRDYRTDGGDLGAKVPPDFSGGKTHEQLQGDIHLNPPVAGDDWLDADGDGIDDAWEIEHADDPVMGCYDDQDDSMEDCDQDGYTDLEEFLHFRAQELEGNILFGDEFEDWTVPASPNWSFPDGDWTETEGDLHGSRKAGEDETLAEADGVFATCDEDCSVAATLRATNTAGATAAEVRLLAWKQAGADTFVAVKLRPHAGATGGQVVIERQTAGVVDF